MLKNLGPSLNFKPGHAQTHRRKSQMAQPEVQRFIGRHDFFDQRASFLVLLPVRHLVLHVRALEEAGEAAFVAHQRDGERVEHGVAVRMFQVHHFGVASSNS